MRYYSFPIQTAILEIEEEEEDDDRSTQQRWQPTSEDFVHGAVSWNEMYPVRTHKHSSILFKSLLYAFDKKPLSSSWCIIYKFLGSWLYYNDSCLFSFSFLWTWKGPFDAPNLSKLLPSTGGVRKGHTVHNAKKKGKGKGLLCECVYN
jgi:hypothetical protein